MTNCHLKPRHFTKAKKVRKIPFPMKLEEVLQGFIYSQTLEVKTYSSNGEVVATQSRDFNFKIPPGTQAGWQFGVKFCSSR